MGSVVAVSILVMAYFTQFFRSPVRIIDKDSRILYAPADGRLVVVEETLESEYFKDRRLQVSIFMSPYNAHSNRSPLSGELVYYKYHPGKFLLAWHPKSSELNERSTLVIRSDKGTEIMLRQIAGAVARRIVTYPVVGDRLEQGEELGFIKFGSRVDLFLPLGTKIDVPTPALLQLRTGKANNAATANKKTVLLMNFMLRPRETLQLLKTYLINAKLDLKVFLIIDR